TFPTTAFPSYSLLISSMIGPTILQGPHQTAQKSTNTGLSDFKTTSSKVASVISKAIIYFFCFVQNYDFIFNLLCVALLVFVISISAKLIQLQINQTLYITLPVF